MTGGVLSCAIPLSLTITLYLTVMFPITADLPVRQLQRYTGHRRKYRQGQSTPLSGFFG